jgi:hypothetical protein
MSIEHVHIKNEKSEEKKMSGHALKFIIAGGGTGGHIFPAIAIAHAIKKQCSNAEFLFVGAKGKMEMEKVPQAGFKIEGLDIAGFNRSSLIKNIGLPIKLVKSFFQVRKIFSSKLSSYFSPKLNAWSVSEVIYPISLSSSIKMQSIGCIMNFE